MTKDELIAALEKATGPSQKLDAHILAVIYAPDADVRQSPFNARWCLYRSGTLRTIEDRHIPKENIKYTESIDAAVSLYETRPTMIPSEPIPNCIAALKARAND
jgi:hypothetical protein